MSACAMCKWQNTFSLKYELVFTLLEFTVFSKQTNPCSITIFAKHIPQVLALIRIVFSVAEK